MCFPRPSCTLGRARILSDLSFCFVTVVLHIPTTKSVEIQCVCVTNDSETSVHTYQHAMTSFTQTVPAGTTLRGVGPVTQGLTLQVHSTQPVGAPALRGDFTLLSEDAAHASAMERHLGDDVSHNAFVAIQSALPKSAGELRSRPRVARRRRRHRRSTHRHRQPQPFPTCGKSLGRRILHKSRIQLFLKTRF